MSDKKKPDIPIGDIFIDNNKGLQPTSTGTPMPKVKPAKPQEQPQRSTAPKKES